MSPQEQHILSIDMGTSGPKVALFTKDGRLLGYEYEATPFTLLPGGGAEQNPADWWQAICTATRRLLARLHAPPTSLAAICCSTQWSGTVAVDADGQALMNAIIWMDSRGAPHARRVTGGPVQVAGYGADKLLTWIRLTGGIPGQAGKDSIAHILYLQTERPEIYARTYKFLEPKDYLNLRLTGLFAASYDSIALHWLTDNRDLSRVDYHPRLLALAGIARDKLPVLRRAVDVLGPLTPLAAADLGLEPGVPVVMGTPDLQAAALGSGAAGDYQAHLYIGTSAWIACHVPYKKTDVLHNIGALPSAIPGKYLVSNEQQTAGACLNFLRDNLFYSRDALAAAEAPADFYARLDAIAAATPAGSHGLIFTPWLNGERTPVDEHTLRAGFYNLSLAHTRQDMVRAVYEGVALNARWLLGYVEKFVNRRLEGLHLVGGGAKSDAWCQIFADVFDREIHQVKDPILANARGAAFLACVALGTLTFADLNARAEIARTYRPTPAHRGVYDAAYREFINIYRANSPIHARMNHR